METNNMKTKKRILPVCIIAGIIVLILAALLVTAGVMSAKGYGMTAGTYKPDDDVLGIADLTKEIESQNSQSSQSSLDNFSFSLTWNCYGVSSYDSETGKLVKTTDATNPEDYITTYHLTDAQKQQIYEMIKDLDITSYPDEYNPDEYGTSIPSMNLILSVKTDDIDKTVTAKETVLSYQANNAKEQKLMDVCESIRDILTETEEWKALPDYEFLYD